MSWKKWECPDDFLTVERKLNSLQLTPQQLDELAMTYFDIELRKAKTPEERAAWATLKVKKQSAVVSKGVNESFVEDFQLWLQGRSKYNKKVLKTSTYSNGKLVNHERSCTPWGNADLLHLPDVREWLKLPLLNRDLVIKELSTLKMKTPGDLEECWEYYKYMVRGVGIDGDSVKEQRNYNQYDYIEKIPVVTTGKTDEGGDFRIVPTEDPRFTRLSILNPSMPKFDEEGYKHVYKDSINKANTGDADLLSSDQFASLLPEDKLYVASILSTNIKIDATAFKEIADSGINSLIDQLTEYLDEAMDIDVGKASSKEEKSEARKKSVEEKRKLKEEERKRKKEEKEKEKSEKKKKIAAATEGKAIESLKAEIKLLKEKKEKSKTTESSKNTQKYLDDQTKKIRSELENTFKEKAKKSTDGLKKQITSLTKETENLREVIKGLEKKKEKKIEMEYPLTPNIFPGRKLEGGKIGESDVITDFRKEIRGPLKVAGFINNALEGLEVTDMWDKIFIERYYSRMTERITESISVGGGVLDSMVTYISENQPTKMFNALKRNFKENVKISPILSDLANAYHGPISDEISERISRSFIQLASTTNPLERESAVYELSSLYGTNDKTNKENPAIVSIMRLAHKLSDRDQIEKYTKSLPGSPNIAEVKNKLIEHMIYPTMLSKDERDTLVATTGLIPHTARTSEDLNKFKYIEESGRYFIQTSALEKNKREEITEERYMREVNAGRILELLSDGMNLNVNKRAQLKKLGNNLKHVNIENALNDIPKLLNTVNETMILKNGSDDMEETENLKKALIEKEVTIQQYSKELQELNQDREETEEEKKTRTGLINELGLKLEHANKEKQDFYNKQVSALWVEYAAIIKKWNTEGNLDIQRDYEKRNDIRKFYGNFRRVKELFPLNFTAETFGGGGIPNLIDKLDEYNNFINQEPMYRKQLEADVVQMLSNPEGSEGIFDKYKLIDEARLPAEALKVTQDELIRKKRSIDEAAESTKMLAYVNSLIDQFAVNMNNAEAVKQIRMSLANIERGEQGFFISQSISVAERVNKLLGAISSLAQNGNGESEELRRLREELDLQRKQLEVFKQPKLDMDVSLTEDQLLNKEYVRIAADYARFMSGLKNNRIPRGDSKSNDYIVSKLNELHGVVFRYGARQSELKNSVEKMKAFMDDASTKLGEEGGVDVSQYAEVIRERKKLETIALGLDGELAEMWEYIYGYTSLLGNSRYHDPTDDNDKHGYPAIESGSADMEQRAANYRNAVLAFENMSKLTNDSELLWNADKKQIDKAMHLLDLIQSKMQPYGNDFNGQEMTIYTSINNTIKTLNTISNMSEEEKEMIRNRKSAEAGQRKRESVETEDVELEDVENGNISEDDIEVDHGDGVTEIIKREGQEFAPSPEDQERQHELYIKLLFKKELSETEKEEFNKLKSIFGSNADRRPNENPFSSNDREYQNQKQKVKEPKEKKQDVPAKTGGLLELVPVVRQITHKYEKEKRAKIFPGKILEEINDTKSEKMQAGGTPLLLLGDVLRGKPHDTEKEGDGLLSKDITTKKNRKEKLDQLTIEELNDEKIHIESLDTKINESVEKIVLDIKKEIETEAESLGMTVEEYRKFINEVDIQVAPSEEELLEKELEIEKSIKRKNAKIDEKKIKTLIDYWENINADSEEEKKQKMSETIFKSVVAPDSRIDKLKPIISGSERKILNDIGNDENAHVSVRSIISDSTPDQAIDRLFDMQRTNPLSGTADRFSRYYHHGEVYNKIYSKYEESVPKANVPKSKYIEFTTFLDYDKGTGDDFERTFTIQKDLDSLLSGKSGIGDEYIGEDNEVKSYSLISDNYKFNTISFNAIHSAFKISSILTSTIKKETENISFFRESFLTTGEASEQKKQYAKDLEMKIIGENKKKAKIDMITEEYISRINSYQDNSEKLSQNKLSKIAGSKFDVGKFYRDMTLNVMYDSINLAKELQKFSEEKYQEKVARGEGGERRIVKHKTEKRDFLNKKYVF